VVAGLARVRAVDRALSRIDEPAFRSFGVDFRTRTPLWESDRVSQMLAQRITGALDGRVGPDDAAVLVCDGEPEQWRRSSPAGGEQENFFVQRVRATLAERGFDQQRVRMAWLEWESPDIAEVLRHFAALGSDRVVVVPAGMPFDSIESTLDLRAAADRASLESGLQVQTLAGWGDDEVVADVISESALAALNEQE
jgi:protoheme ferro-lyase